MILNKCFFLILFYHLQKVSKRFILWIDTIKPNELAINGLLFKKYFHTDDAIDDGNSIENIDLSMFEKMKFDLSGLRRFKLGLKSNDRPNLDWIQKLIEPMKRLDHLELACLKCEIKLKLPDQIKKLYILCNEPHHMEIDCDSLEFFGFYGANMNVKLSNPTKLTHLYAYCNENYDRLLDFKNIKILSIDYPLLILGRNILQNFSNLKEFRFDRTKYIAFNYSVTERMMNQLLEQKRSMKSNIKIYFDDQLIDDDKKFSDHGFNEQSEFFTRRK